MSGLTIVCLDIGKRDDRSISTCSDGRSCLGESDCIVERETDDFLGVSSTFEIEKVLLKVFRKSEEDTTLYEALVVIDISRIIGSTDSFVGCTMNTIGTGDSLVFSL